MGHVGQLCLRIQERIKIKLKVKVGSWKKDTSSKARSR